MGASNYVILNQLQRKEELRMTATTQQGGAAAAADPGGVAAAANREPEAELPPLPPPAQMQQVDWTVSSTPSRGTSSPQAYDEFEDDLYGDDRQERGVRRPQMRPVGLVRRINHQPGRAAASKGGRSSPSVFRHGTWPIGIL